MKSSHVDMIEIIETLDIYIQKEFALLAPNSRDIEIFLEGPNVIFRDSSVQYKVSLMKFKAKKTHTSFDNLIGSVNILCTVQNKYMFPKSKIVVMNNIMEKIKAAIKIAKTLCDANVFNDKSDYKALIMLD